MSRAENVTQLAGVNGDSLQSHAPAGQPAPRNEVRLGEELPVFCERCGYSLHGLAQVRCGQCSVLYFSCPECNHHQPINTWRPAAQRVLGRLRAAWLAWSIFFRLNFFGWLLFAWFSMGAVPAELTPELILAFALFGLPFGMVSRMFLLRWKRGWLVGGVLALLVFAAVVLGAEFQRSELSRRGAVAQPVATDLYLVALIGCLCVTLGAAVVWPIWMSLAHLFLPRRTAAALLDWQRSFSGKEIQLGQQ